MISNKRTGCVVITSAESAICLTYIFEGRIVGVYSFAEGWLTKTEAAVLDCLDYMADTNVILTILPVETDNATTLTESLSDLASQRFAS